MTTVSAYVGTVTQIMEGQAAWTNPSFAAGAPNGAKTTISSFAVANSLQFSDFGFSLPSNATVTGIVLTPTGVSNDETADNSVYLYGVGGALKYSTVLTDVDPLNSSADGLGLSYSDINSLAVVFTFSTQGDASWIELDAIQASVTYSIVVLSRTGSTFRNRLYRGCFGRQR